MSALPATPLDTTILEAELASDYRKRPNLRLATTTETPQKAPRPNTVVHSNVFKILAGLNAFVLLSFWATFQGDKEALFMVAISAVYLVAYMGTPYILMRTGKEKQKDTQSFGQFLSEPFETWTETITGRGAMIQILMVPTAITIAVLGMCIIISLNQ
ncbi:hypothetical protein [Hyphococcus lacteus]|uniref:Uncharacterized protein n=1 Tax=Hyphococcus lacteus TaxID=3143536 RepID=A0ABV3Z2N6_9PROT